MKCLSIIIVVSIAIFSLLSFTKYKKRIVTVNVSWYGSTHHGKLTASGEKFNMYEYTAAHKTLPFGTKVLITNPVNGCNVIVTINDRGPFIKTREFDLSKAAFLQIAPLSVGIIKVEYKILK
mgnify:FL=1